MWPLLQSSLQGKAGGSHEEKHILVINKLR